MLTVETTHLKPGYLRRNGLARSEKATLREHFIRNGNVLTWISIVSDPVYLTEPYIKSRNFFVRSRATRWRCIRARSTSRCSGRKARSRTTCRAANPYLDEFAMKWALPREAVRGGAETMYPEYAEKMKRMTPLRKPRGTRRRQERSDEARRSRRARLRPLVAARAQLGAQSTSATRRATRGRFATNVFMLVGPGANTTVQIGRDGVLVVDPQADADVRAVLAAIRRLSGQAGPVHREHDD